MTTPIEVAALAVDSLPWDGQRGGVDPGNVEIARAVFESIDRDGLIAALRSAETEVIKAIRQNLKATTDGVAPDPDSTARVEADAIIAYLTGGQS